MLAKISIGKSVFGVLNYNKIKVEDKEADVLFTQKMFDSVDGKFSIRDCMDSFYPYLANNNRTENVVFHASLNPDPKDKLSNERLSKIAQTYMEKLGYGNQPYVVFKHSDIQRQHLHIVSLHINETGKKINDSYEVRRSMKICKELEQEFNLIPLKKGQRENEVPTKKIDYKKGDLKHQVSNITKSIINSFHFQSFGEYRSLLEMFNVTAEEVKGERNGKAYQGLIYSVIDDKGEKVGVPFKASLFGKTVGHKALLNHYALSKSAIEKNKVRENMRPIISEAVNKCSSMDNFKSLLREKNRSVIFRQNDSARIYGATFIDYENKAILNGSRLGKGFSANVLHELFKNAPVEYIEQPKIESSPSINQSATQQDVGSDILSPLAFEQHGTDYEAESFAREKENEEKVRQRKRRGRRI